MDQYATHLPVLARALRMYPGTVLEAGLGHYSNGLIRALVPDTNAVLSIEDNLAWVKAVRPKNPTEAWASFQRRSSGFFDVVFVDGPRDQRAPLIAQMLTRCRVLVLHDSNEELDREYHHLGPLQEAKHLWTYNKVYPSTTVASMTEDVAAAFRDLED